MRLLFVLSYFLLTTRPGLSQNNFETEHVFLITLDGLRWQELFAGADPVLISDETYVSDVDALAANFGRADFESGRRALMPFFWSVIVDQGQLYGNRALGCTVGVTNDQWFSYPGYNEILVGYADPNITSNDKVPNSNQTVLEVLHAQASFQGKVAAFGSWDVFPYIVNEDRSGVHTNAGFENATGNDLTDRERFLNELQGEIPSPWGTVRLDAFTHHYAVEYLKKHHPRLLYIAYGETDDFAHDGDYDAYLNAAHRTDRFIRDLWDFAQHDPQYRDKTTFVITTDHGRGTDPIDTWRSHGTDIVGADQTWMAFLGPDTPRSGEISSCELYQNQIASTVARFLGIDYQNRLEVGAPVASAFK